jgi:DNA helicase-2/ATP-dependent DNA helicase PcrA
VGAVSFFERREVKDLLSYLRLIANPSDDVAFLRAVAAPRRGIGVSTLEHLASDASAKGLSLLAASQSGEITAGLRPAARVALHAFAELIAGFALSAQTASVAHLLGDIVKETGYDDFLRREDGAEAAAERLENVRELASSAAALADEDSEDEVGTELELFLQRSALIAQIDALDPTVDAVTLMTVHNAKGLEFPVVFISGLEDGLFPLARAHDDPALMEEERRLLYVGITRAERKLYLSYAASRRRNGELRQSVASSFLREAGSGLWTEEPSMRFRSAARASSAPSYSTGFRRTYGVPGRRAPIAAEDISQEEYYLAAGTRVRHGRFGAGTVADVAGVGREAKVTVDFDDESVGRKRLVVAYAGLESGGDE